MKKTIAFLLAAALTAGCFTGCAAKDDEEPYVPTGNAIVLEGQEPDDFLPDEEEIQEVTLVYNPDMSMNQLAIHSIPPISKSGITHRMTKIMKLGKELLAKYNL